MVGKGVRGAHRGQGVRQESNRGNQGGAAIADQGHRSGRMHDGRRASTRPRPRPERGRLSPTRACSAPPGGSRRPRRGGRCSGVPCRAFAGLGVGVRLVDWVCGHARRGRTDTTVACRRGLRRFLTRPAGSHGNRSDRATLWCSLASFGLNRTFDAHHCALLTLSVISMVRVGRGPTPGAPRHQQRSTRRGGALRLTFDKVVGRS